MANAKATKTDATHKHVHLHNRFVRMLPDDDGALREVEEHHAADMDVAVEDLDAFLADARQRWVDIEVSDTCPEECTAQLAPGV